MVTDVMRAVRRQRGLTLDQLAGRTGLTKSYLSKIERGQAVPSIAAALKVAGALDVDVARLFSEDSAAGRIAVDRAVSGQPGRALAAGLLGKAMSPFVVHPSDAAAHPHATHSGQEFVFVHTGRVELIYGEETILLGPGDSAYFDASINHGFRAVGTTTAEVLVVAYHEPGSPR